MSSKSQLSRKLSNTGGNTAIRILLIILGALELLFGLLLVIVSIGMFFDGDADMLGLFPIALLILVSGGVIISYQVALKPADTSSAALPAGTKAGNVLEERVTSVTTLSEVPGTDSASTGQTQGIPAGQTPSGEGPTEDVAHLVFRSSDLFATLRELARHESKQGSDKLHLATMLNASGILDWPDAPTCEGGRLSRTNHFWIRLATDELTDEQYDTLISAEAALSVNQELPDERSLPLTDRRVTLATEELMRSMASQVIAPSDLTAEGLRVAYQTTDPKDLSEEWVVRSIVCNAAECAKTPFRVVYDLRANMGEHTVFLSLEIPRPRCMAIFTDDPQRQKALARAYALRLAVLIARHAFGASNKVETVLVNCHAHEDESVLLSLRLDGGLTERLRGVVATSRVEDAFPEHPGIRANLLDGWFAPLDAPFAQIDDPALTPAESRMLPELDQRPAPESIRRSCGAERICDLGINENAARIAAWNEIRTQLGTSTETAVSALVAARDRTKDITVAEACTRCIQMLVDGGADPENLAHLSDLFVDGSSLDRAVERANKLLDEDGQEDPEAALKILNAALAPIDDMGVYLDDERYVYRYFGSVSERIRHNARIDEGGREIVLVPDSYFNAHNSASIALGMLGRFDEALAHADINLRLAPTSTFATMRKVRVLEAMSRIYEAADLIIAALRLATTPREASLCHYRLAYMEWKLGREDLAVACYQRSMNWDTDMRRQAEEELEDLLGSNPQLTRLTDEQADALLAREGIPLGCVRTDGEQTLAAAVSCIDNGILLIARPLMAAYFGMNGDDVVMGIYRSLNVSV